MTALALLLSAVLLLITALHAYWGIGGIWPGRDGASCARAVVGLRGVAEMPSPTACFAVALSLLLATLWPLALAGIVRSPFPDLGLALVAILFGIAFLVRGLVGFMPAWRRLTPEQPFARLDVRLYSPLALLLGAAFLVLGIGGFPA